MSEIALATELRDAPQHDVQARHLVYRHRGRVLGLRHLVDADMDERIIRSGKRRILLGPCFSAAAILLSFLDARLSLGVYVLFPIIFILPGRIDRFWPRQEMT